MPGGSLWGNQTNPEPAAAPSFSTAVGFEDPFIAQGSPTITGTQPGWKLGSPGRDLPSSLLLGQPQGAVTVSFACRRSAWAVFQRRAHKYFVSSAGILIQHGAMHFASNWGGGGAAERRPSPGVVVPAGCWHSSSAPRVPERGRPACRGTRLQEGAGRCPQTFACQPRLSPPGSPSSARAGRIAATPGARRDLAGDRAATQGWAWGVSSLRSPRGFQPPGQARWWSEMHPLRCRMRLAGTSPALAGTVQAKAALLLVKWGLPLPPAVPGALRRPPARPCDAPVPRPTHHCSQPSAGLDARLVLASLLSQGHFSR